MEFLTSDFIYIIKRLNPNADGGENEWAHNFGDEREWKAIVWKTEEGWKFNITLNFTAYLERVGESDVDTLSAPGTCKQNDRH